MTPTEGTEPPRDKPQPGVRFRAGDRVRVQDRHPPRHMRTPRYIRGQVGEVVAFCGLFLNPEALAEGDTSGPAIALYRVRFAMSDLWPEQQGADPPDWLYIELYDHWLSPMASSGGGDHE